MDFVQQGALIALALVLVEQPESRAKPLREHINRLYGNKASEVCDSKLRRLVENWFQLPARFGEGRPLCKHAACGNKDPGGKAAPLS